MRSEVKWCYGKWNKLTFSETGFKEQNKSKYALQVEEIEFDIYIKS